MRRCGCPHGGDGAATTTSGAPIHAGCARIFLAYICASALVTEVSQYCLQQLLVSQNIESECVDRLLLSLIVHCSKDDDHARAIKTIDVAFSGEYL